VKNRCGNYRANWDCPPALDSMQEQAKIRACRNAFIFTTKWALEDSYDV
jgi:predicted metal-binding protein